MNADRRPLFRFRGAKSLPGSSFRLDYLDQNLGQRLRRRRQHWINMTLVVAFCLGLALMVNLVVPELLVKPWPTIFGVGYGVACSLLASFLVFAYLAHRDLVELHEETPHGLKLLSIVPEMRSDKGRAVIVLPVFPVSPGVPNKKIDLESGTVPLSTTDIRRTAHSRRDMLVAHDILRLFYKAGLPRPIVLKDDDFCRQMLEPRQNKSPLTVREDTDEPNARQHRVSAILSVGLFSNRFTLAMSQDPKVPFDIAPNLPVGDEVDGSASSLRHRRELKIYRPRVDGRPHDHGFDFETVRMPEDEAAGPDAGLIARLNCKDIPVCFVGGMTALATVRLGDFLFNRPDWSDDFFELSQYASTRSDVTFCAVVRCPGVGKRNGTFEPRVVYWDGDRCGGVQGHTAVSLARPAILNMFGQDLDSTDTGHIPRQS